MKATEYNKRQIMRNAWNLKRRNASVSFSECLSITWSRAKCDVLEARRNEAKRVELLNTPFVPLTINTNYVGGMESLYQRSGQYSGD